MNRTRLATGLLALGMFIPLLAGCSSQSNPGDTGPSPATAGAPLAPASAPAPNLHNTWVLVDAFKNPLYKSCDGTTLLYQTVPGGIAAIANSAECVP